MSNVGVVGKNQAADNATAGSAAAMQPAPGKRPLTAGLQRSAGSQAPTVKPGAGAASSPALWDEIVPGAAAGLEPSRSDIGVIEPTPCDEDPNNPECLFSEYERAKLLRGIDTRAVLAAGNWLDAISDEKVALLTKAPTGWNFLWELGAMAMTWGIGTAALKAVGWINSLPHRLPFNGHILIAKAMNGEASILVGVRALASVGERTKKHVQRNDAKDPSLDLLNDLKRVPSRWADGISNSLAPSQTDVGLAVLFQMLDPAFHAPEVYQQQVQDLLTKLQTEVLSIGESVAPPDSSASHVADHHEVAVWVKAKGQRRLAICASVVEWEEQKANPERKYQRHVFLRWVSPEMMEAAQEAHRSRFGEPPEVDALDGPFLGVDKPEVRQWLDAGV